MSDDYLTDVFGPGGLFASRFPGYEMREGQVALARMVDQAMRDGRHALLEGPCGSGKSISHAVPAVWHAHHRKKRVVIATANIALQEQLIKKDLPMLASVLPWPFTYALLKGRNNFLCRERHADSEARGELGTLYDADQRQADDILAWARETSTGDVSELPFVPAPAVWSRFAVGSDECLGTGCQYRATCFSERAKTAAQDADIIVTNYHLLCVHLATRRETGEDLVLPAFDLLVLDEAHRLAEIAREYFGFTSSEHAARRLARAAEDFGDRELGQTLRREAKQLFEAIDRVGRSPSYRCRLRTPGFASAGALVAALAALTRLAQQTAMRAAARASGDDDSGEAVDHEKLARIAKARNVRRQAETLAARLQEAVSLSDPGKVYFIETEGKARTKLGAKVIDVASILRAELFDRTASVTLMSATMTTGGTFDFLRKETGVPKNALELVAESPFDFAKQALLILPPGIPDPREPGFVDAVKDTVQQVIDTCGGRTLALFTSYKNLNAVYDGIAGNGHRVLRQGDLPPTELARQFKDDIDSVLLGTESFWTGIDVPGPALTAVVIDKLPFPHPDDPVVDAICARDPRAFSNYLIPRAIILLRQGVGRLIRAQTDIGVVVLLDRRIAEKPYGKRFLRSLPPMMTSRKLDNIARFLEEATHAVK